jgi:hypothetical protein
MVATRDALFWIDPLPAGDAGPHPPANVEGIAK